MKIEADVKGFEADLRKFAKVVDEDFDKVFRKIVFLLFRNVVFLTPVLTGRARSNWQIGINEPNLDTNMVGIAGALGEGAASSAAINAATKELKEKLYPGDVVYITNNVDYIAILEDGTESRPAYNMVKGAMMIVGRGLQGAL